MKITLLSLLMFIATMNVALAQNFPINFETGTYNITNFDGGVMTVINNPHSSGINTSAKVAQMIKNAGQPWAGSYITLADPIDFSTKKIFKMKVYSPKAGTKVLLKVENPSNTTIFYEKEMTTKLASQWEELQFDYSKIDVTKSYRNLVVIFDLGTMGDGSANFTYLLDDIALMEGVIIPADAPTIAAPTPPAFNASKVISIFSEAYTNLDGTNLNPYWQQATVGSIENYSGNSVLRLFNLNYQGIELAGEVNAASMKYLHLDVWTADETKLDIYPISRTTGERKASLTPLKFNEWNSYNIKISDITTQGFNLADLIQFKFVGAGGHTVYVDNLYLYDDNAAADTEAPVNFTATLSTVTYNSVKLLLNATDNSGAVNYFITVGATTTKVGAASGVQKSYEYTRLPSSTEFTFSISAKDLSGNSTSNTIQIVTTTSPAFPAPVVSSPTPPSRSSGDVISIFSDIYTNIPNTNFNPNWQQSSWFNSLQVGGNEVLEYENFNYQGIEIGSSVNASAMQYLHLDVWTPNETSLSISPISKSTGEKAVKLSPIKLNEWNSYDIPLSSFTIQGLSMADIIHLKFVGSGKSIIYLDNIYFYKGSPLTAITDNKSERAISYYPNPVLNNLNIKSETEIRSIEVYTITGQRIKRVTLKTFDTSIDLNDITQGAYFIAVTLKNGSRSIQKIVKK